MNIIFFACAAILCALWTLGFFIFHAGVYIHALLVIAVLALVLSVLEKKQSLT